MIQKHLPQELVKRIDIDSVQLTNKSFVSEAMQKLHSDVIYKCNIDNKKGALFHNGWVMIYETGLKIDNVIISIITFSVSYIIVVSMEMVTT